MTRRELVASGWSQERITTAVRAGRLDRLLPGTYAKRSPDGAHDVRAMLAAATAHFGPCTVAVLATAAYIHDLPVPWPNDGLVHLRLARGREQVQRAGFRIHTWLLPEADCTLIDGQLVTTIERTLVDLMCTSDRLSAVATLDAALARSSITPDVVQLLKRQTVRRRGAARSRTWWDAADARAESPLETRIRLRAADGGYPPDELQKTFVVDGRSIRTDFAWRKSDGRWLVGEADGRSVHDQPEALHHDRARANALVSVGDVDIARFTWADSVPLDRVPHILSRILGPSRGHQRP